VSGLRKARLSDIESADQYSVRLILSHPGRVSTPSFHTARSRGKSLDRERQKHPPIFAMLAGYLFGWAYPTAAAPDVNTLWCGLRVRFLLALETGRSRALLIHRGSALPAAGGRENPPPSCMLILVLASKSCCGCTRLCPRRECRGRPAVRCITADYASPSSPSSARSCSHLAIRRGRSSLRGGNSGVGALLRQATKVSQASA